MSLGMKGLTRVHSAEIPGHFLEQNTPGKLLKFCKQHTYTGKRIEWSPIWSVIVRVITKLDGCEFYKQGIYGVKQADMRVVTYSVGKKASTTSSRDAFCCGPVQGPGNIAFSRWRTPLKLLGVLSTVNSMNLLLTPKSQVQ